jgi:hypothetical protein
MSGEGIASDAPQSADVADDVRQFCYRHPQRETYIRCGRCDRPICTACAMQGPVGARCRQCGRPAYDPLTSFTAQQLALGTGVALAGGLVVGFVGAQIGWFSIILAFIAGGFIAEGVRRVTGYKQGPMMLAIVLGGILLGALAGYAADVFLIEAAWLAEMEAEGLTVGAYLSSFVVWGLIDGGAACLGAWYRLR